MSNLNENDRAFEAAKKVICCIHKEDVPEVQAVIRLLTPTLENFWRLLIAEAMVSLLDQLDQLGHENGVPSVTALARLDAREAQRRKEELIAALLSLLDTWTSRPPSSVGAALVRSSIVSLLRDGAKANGEPLDLLREPLMTQAAMGDLLTLLRGRLELHKAELRDLLGRFLTTAGPRTPSASSLAGIASAAAGQAALDRQGWIEAVKAALGVETASWIPLVIDQWAYRWYNIGGFTASRQNGSLAFMAKAVRDNRTSAFCRWVDGRIVSVQKIQGQLDRHIRASLDGNLEAILTNWPMLTFKPTDGPAEFAMKFRSVGLPPYHPYCRTQAVPIRVG